MDLSKFATIKLEWDEGNLTEIDGHDISDWECEECFFNAHEVYRNKRKQRRYTTYRLLGTTDAGKRVNVIFFVHERYRTTSGRTVAVVRIITAWPVE